MADVIRLLICRALSMSEGNSHKAIRDLVNQKVHQS
jgi:hypothetical protein